MINSESASAAQVPAAAEISPYFQPILSLQTQHIIGYEALGRHVAGGVVRSLGPFFQQSGLPDERLVKVDRLIREQAIAAMARAPGEERLFLNLKPSWIYRKARRVSELPTLQMAERHGLDPSRIVVEITEEPFSGKLEELSEMIGLYREAGCTIAIDDIGSGHSNYDRIASLQPHILKIDLKLMKKGARHEGYHALLNSFSILAAQMGASMLVEGVETKEDLHYALKVGARYVQGFLFSPAEAELQRKEAYEPLLREHIALYTHGELERHRALFSAASGLRTLLSARSGARTPAEADALLQTLSGHVDKNVVRMYICREEGFQVSSNYTRNPDGSWRRDAAYEGSNWIWRPYFIPTVLQMKHGGQGCLSQPYTDLETSRSMQTYSEPLGEAHYIFFDLEIDLAGG
ncbi:EAL domain, c-di-GMP-specific phosphodiesterase class I (or its enzymatically inactive variant) [Paenibacillus sp. UNCCL117]|uniref:EAL domain-containing protein n=1 Tax=unclassified Paenibacillus TaxID=185978 RepID=UPI0008875DB1|nr:MULTISPECIES: EAL domain-containing protein [unclassified Paenibacillus]SDD16176.1 EAL domain, c-di-GMP-specific phosphodiesterase class I (or its enzymatically inactive variant) [Paenibacillus sp. cl123]SFW34628.1 EAL domain, c-di-GMP-specific phosphodiesterase class I (or its enzymatically inactive variant) [Paenibacillus sp. UNCCL117]